MKDDARQWLARACRRLLRPVVRILLQHGIAYRDFAEIARGVYVDVAREASDARGRPPTDSRVAVVTGLTRKEVRRLREAGDQDYVDPTWGGANRATRVLAGWHRDPDFNDDRGHPRVLDFGDADSGFTALVRRYSGDIPVNAVFEELERVGAVDIDDRDQVSVLGRAYVPMASDPESLRMLGTASHDLLATIAHNIGRHADTPARFQCTVFNARVDVRALPVFHRLASEHGQQLLETLDDWLERHEIDEQDTETPVVRTGVGIYYFQDAPRSEENKNDD